MVGLHFPRSSVPASHSVSQRSHECGPVATLKKPTGHGSQVGLVRAVQGALSCWPAGQLAAHASQRFVVALRKKPAGHGTHCGELLPVQGVVCSSSPAGQLVVQAMQGPVPAGDGW